MWIFLSFSIQPRCDPWCDHFINKLPTVSTLIFLAKLELERYSEEHTCGVTLEQKVSDHPCTFTIAKKKDERETIHEGYCLWNAAKTSSYLWECLKKNGKLSPDPSLTPPPPDHHKSDDEKKEKAKKIYKCKSHSKDKLIKYTVYFRKLPKWYFLDYTKPRKNKEIWTILVESFQCSQRVIFINT